MADQDLVVIEPQDEVLEEVNTENEVNTETSTESEDELTVTIGEEEPPSSDQVDEEEIKAAPKWVKDLREKAKEDARRLREAEHKAEELEKALKAKEGVEELPELEEEPTLENCDFDDVLFKQKFTSWLEVKKTHENNLKVKQEEVNKSNEAYQAKVNSYKEASTKLKVSDFADAETDVKRKLDATQQGIIVSYSKKPELLVYALGKNPKALDELSAIKDPIQYAIAIADLESKLKVTPKKAPPPESKIVGKGMVTSDAKLARLRAEAEKTGDYTSVTAYKKQLKT